MCAHNKFVLQVGTDRMVVRSVGFVDCANIAILHGLAFGVLDSISIVCAIPDYGRGIGQRLGCIAGVVQRRLAARHTWPRLVVARGGRLARSAQQGLARRAVCALSRTTRTAYGVCIRTLLNKQMHWSYARPPSKDVSQNLVMDVFVSSSCWTVFRCQRMILVEACVLVVLAATAMALAAAQ